MLSAEILPTMISHSLNPQPLLFSVYFSYSVAYTSLNPSITRYSLTKLHGTSTYFDLQSYLETKKAVVEVALDKSLEATEPSGKEDHRVYEVLFNGWG